MSFELEDDWSAALIILMFLIIGASMIFGLQKLDALQQTAYEKQTQFMNNCVAIKNMIAWSETVKSPSLLSYLLQYSNECLPARDLMV